MFRDFEAMRAAKNSSNVFGGGDTVKLVLIHNNRWLLPDNKDDITTCEEPCYVHVRGGAALLGGLLGGAEAVAMQLPDRPDNRTPACRVASSTVEQGRAWMTQA